VVNESSYKANSSAVIDEQAIDSEVAIAAPEGFASVPTVPVALYKTKTTFPGTSPCLER